MLKFLDDKAIADSIKSLLQQAQEGEQLELAVAYWGKDATKRLGIDGSKPVRIVCDLLSGGCNPNEIQKLRTTPFDWSIEIKHLPGLHTKVYRTPKCVIVGSANASANGLGDEGRIGTLEAAIQSDDQAVLDQTASWFKELWEKKAKKIDDTTMKQAREAWRRRRPKADPRSTVLETLIHDPEWFRGSVWITYYTSDVSDNAKAKFEEIKEKYYSAYQLKRFETEGLPIYDWPRKDASKVSIGDIMLDLAEKKIYELIELSDYSAKHCIAMLKPRTDVLGLGLPAPQRSKLKKAIKMHLGGRKTNFACNLEEMPEDVTRYLAAQLL